MDANPWSRGNPYPDGRANSAFAHKYSFAGEFANDHPNRNIDTDAGRVR
ncbi:MAG: hypothetical protein O3A33_07405 [Chloroflexi bacterium]|nr:hypothetical protein [Chloroflexota bacterium]